jgi:glycogen synthase
LNGKQAITDSVRESLCLRASVGPLFGIVSRLVHQKGLDLVAGAADDIVEKGGQIAILGLGDPEAVQPHSNWRRIIPAGSKHWPSSARPLRERREGKQT